MTTIPHTTVLKVTNLDSSRTYRFMWERETWVLPPGEVHVVPYYGAVSWFGDPRSINVGDPDRDAEKQTRTAEIRRLSVLYGTYDNPWFMDHPHLAKDYSDSRDETDHHYVQRDDGKFWHPHLPCVRVTNMSDVQVLTVLDDPLGDHLTPASASTNAQVAVTEAAMADLQRQLSELQLQYARLQPASDPSFEGTVGNVVDHPLISPEAPSTMEGTDFDELVGSGATVDTPAGVGRRIQPRRPRGK